MKTIVDVRSREEYEAERMPNTINVPIEDILDSKIDKLKDIPKDSCISVCCAGGARAEIAKNVLNKLGFKNVENLGSFKNVNR